MNLNVKLGLWLCNMAGTKLCAQHSAKSVWHEPVSFFRSIFFSLSLANICIKWDNCTEEEKRKAKNDDEKGVQKKSTSMQSR